MFLLVPLPFERASLVAQTVKNLPAIQETWVQSLDQEDPLEKKMATHSSILAWRIPWTRESGINMYTLIYLKWITSKDLLYST